MQKSNNKTALYLLAIIFAMICLVVASVPLYNLFCKITGYSGAASGIASKQIGSKEYLVQFDAISHKDSKINFRVRNKNITTVPGKNNLVVFELNNISNETAHITALYNVLPQKAAQYFIKIECFCYEELTFPAQSYNNLPVSFYLDPAIEEDPFLKNIDKITLSYSVLQQN
jgi:cytochrome c oxidase assembly protein subunit 11